MSGTAGSEALVPARLRWWDLARVAGNGLFARPMRVALSALGISIGAAAIVAVLGLSSSSQASLLAEIDRLGTNLLTAAAGSTFSGQSAQLPLEATARVGHISHVEDVSDTATVDGLNVYRSPLVPAINTNGLQVRAASLNLPGVVAAPLAGGSWLNSATATQPVAVLGATAAERLGIQHVTPGLRVWLGGQWFVVTGILQPSALVQNINTSVLIGYPAAQKYLGYSSMVAGQAGAGPPTTIYVRADTDYVDEVQSVLARTANPQSPNEVDVSQPSDALTARAAANGAFNSLFLGLGVISLLVAAVGVANIMIISVLERRSEIGLRRSLGATRGQIRTQFLTESVILALIGGAVGVVVGVLATVIYAELKSWQIVIPPLAWAGGIGSSVLIGVVAGLLPAIRAARLSPTEALRSM